MNVGLALAENCCPGNGGTPDGNVVVAEKGGIGSGKGGGEHHTNGT